MTPENREQAAEISARLREALRTRLKTFGAQTGMTVDVQELTSKDFDADADLAPMKVVELDGPSYKGAVYQGPGVAPRIYKGRRVTSHFYKIFANHPSTDQCGEFVGDEIIGCLENLRQALQDLGKATPLRAHVLFMQSLTVNLFKGQPCAYAFVGLVVSGPEN